MSDHARRIARDPRSQAAEVSARDPSCSERHVEMREEADDVICLEAHERFGAIGRFYDDFTQVADEHVIAALACSAPATAVKKPAA